MKHLKHLFTALLLLCATAVAAHDFEVGGIYYNILSETDKTVAVTFRGTYFDDYSNEYTGGVVIPQSVTYNGTTYSVTSIGETAFIYCTGLTSIEIPNSVTSIGDYAFYNCSYLANVVIGNSVTSIGEYAFFSCNSLKFVYNNSSLDITEGSPKHGFLGLYAAVVVNKNDILEKVGNFTFHKTDSTVTLVDYTGVDNAISLPASYNGENYAIGKKLFYDKSNIASVFIPNSVISIGHSAFFGCTGLTSITIPNSVTSIGARAFSSCTGLTSVEIPNSVTSIGEYAFSDCYNFSLTLGNGVKYYGLAFASCYPAGIYINDLAVFCESDFNSENHLLQAPLYLNGELITNLIIPDGVTRIGIGVFKESSFTSIEIPNSVTSIGDFAFYNCSGLASITIPNSVTSIGIWAFYNCSGLTSITIPNSVTSIGSGVFADCYRLTSVEIPNSVTSIGNHAFQNCYLLTSVEIPNSVTSIGEYAFFECFNLKEVHISDLSAWCGIDFSNERANPLCYAHYLYLNDELVTDDLVIPDGVTSIGGYAFNYCPLTSVVIPNSVTSIGIWAFYGCSGITSITSLIPADKLFFVENSTFGSVDKATCTLYVPYGAKETYAATAGWNEFVNIVELEPTEVTVTINQYGCATYCSPYALDFGNVEGLKAYAATGYKSNSQVVTLTRVQTAEAGVGLFLKGEPGEYIVPVIESTDEHSLNMLVGTLEPTIVNSTDGSMSNYKFTIADGDEAPMFYPFEDGTTLSAGKAYLQIPTAWLPATAQKSLSVRFDDGETTDIDELKGEDGKEKTIYDLQGRVVENPTSGIYIIDGKKVIIK